MFFLESQAPLSELVTKAGNFLFYKPINEDFPSLEMLKFYLSIVWFIFLLSFTNKQEGSNSLINKRAGPFEETPLAQICRESRLVRDQDCWECAKLLIEHGANVFVILYNFLTVIRSMLSIKMDSLHCKQ